MDARAGGAFVELYVKGGPKVQKGIATIQERLRTFGKSVSVAGIAAGNLLAEGVKEALRQVKEVAKFAWESAKVDPRTQASTKAFEESLNKMWSAFGTVASSIMSAVLPAMTMLVDGLTSAAVFVQQAWESFEQFGAVAAMQTGDVSKAVQILWLNTQIVFSRGSAIILDTWDSMIGTMLDAWDYLGAMMVSVIGESMKSVAGQIMGALSVVAAAMPKLAEQIEPAQDAAKALWDMGNGIKTVGEVSKAAADKQSNERAKAAEMRAEELQRQIAALEKQSNELSKQAIAERDKKRIEDAQAFVGEGGKANNVGTFSSFAASLIGKSDSTAKQQLTVAREQKELGKQQLARLDKIAEKVGVPSFR